MKKFGYVPALLVFVSTTLLLHSFSAKADDPKYHCYHKPLTDNWKFEGGKVSCDLDKTGVATPQEICLETVQCIFITPEIKATLESEAAQYEQNIKTFMGPMASKNIPYSTNLDTMRSDFIPFLMQFHAQQLGGQDYSRQSTFICKYGSFPSLYAAQKGMIVKRCQTIDECRGNLLYNASLDLPPMGQTEYLKKGETFEPIKEVK